MLPGDWLDTLWSCSDNAPQCASTRAGRGVTDRTAYNRLNDFLQSVERRAYRIAFIASGNRDDALDLVQEAMCKLAEKYSDRSSDEWSALFHRILQSKIRDRYRRNAVRNRTDCTLHPPKEIVFDTVGDPEIETRIKAYEMAFRMQSRAPELMDFSQESQATLDLYGAKPGDPKAAYANNALLARRLAERGVRFIQVYHAGWDHHSQVESGLRTQCAQTDQASAALLTDLKNRGLLEDTLVIWGGEFGRTPMVEASAALGRSLGRDHHPQAFTMWFAGGGIKPGVQYGKTDELGFNIEENPVHVHDVQATILRCLGLDHERLSYPMNGLNVKLTGVEKHNPVDAILA